MSFPFYHQHDAMDCGPACLQMIAKYYGKIHSLQTLREYCYANRNGVTLLGISDAAERIGFRAMGIKTDIGKLVGRVVLPCIIHWKQDHFVVVYKVKVHQRNGTLTGNVYVADPAFGHIRYNLEEFCKGWVSTKENGREKGMVLMLAPSVHFYEEGLNDESKKHDISFFFNYLRPHKKFFAQIIWGMLLGLVFQLIFPFLTQSLIDVGVLNNNLNFIILILVTQLVLSTSQLTVNFIQNWIFVHVNTRINVALISDFIFKLLKLPVRFFDSRKTGDIMQRIGDHSRVESFLTSTSLSTLFSTFNFFVFAVILGIYNLQLLTIFVVGYALYVGWVLLFLKVRRELDFRRFEKSAKNQSNIVQLIEGVQEIKLNNCENKMRCKWEKIQAELFEVTVKGLSIEQVQSGGAFFISQTLNIVISVIAAKEVIEGRMTLGMMMSVSYIIGQLKAPVENLIGFVHSYQDAKISLERLGEVHLREDEEQMNKDSVTGLPPEDHSIKIERVSFSYLGPKVAPVLSDITLTIPQNKVTAIVGASGSGKTTLLKLLLGNYIPDSGRIRIGQTALNHINPHFWRSVCGVVMQDGYLFSESVVENIAVCDEKADREKLYDAAVTANIHEFIEELPSGYNTMIGQEGSGISQGQKQRILIARAVYKNPDFLFFDEATNSLDANNEAVIMKNLERFFHGRTVVVVAHRLSTVQNADQIVVLDHGKIVETGNHQQLIRKKGFYYTLVKNQLNLEG
ncbi:peptidase domain-containing ABC transporter [Bacteroides congonensis]|uniref:peptidase domain-containing ABC transporter n=1 Tax=Bacteroides congonensis TaxID=1871006 RepID=UPI003A847C5C